MATSNFSKAALNNARSHKPWERDENDARDDIETLQFDFDDATAPMAPAVGSQLSAAAPEVKHTSVAHEISPVALRHSPPMPDMKGVSALAGNTEAPAGGEKPVELQSAPATVQPSFGAPAAQAIGLTQTPEPQADGAGGTGPGGPIGHDLGLRGLLRNNDAPVDSEKPADMQSAPATVQQSFGAPAAQAIGLTQTPAPQADGIGGPTESIDEDNLIDLYDHLYRDSDNWGGGATVSVRFPQSYGQIPEHFRNIDDGPNYWGNYRFFDETQQAHTWQALATWSDVANITFVPVEPGEEADIYFYGLEFAIVAGGSSTGVDHDHGSRIAINTFLGAVPDLQPGSGGFQTLVHEIGHSLGLSHPGDYDATDDESPTYDDDAEYIQDTQMYSVMSYFSGAETGYSGDGDGLPSLIATPRTHDMFVVQSLYSANFNARDTDSTYGYNADNVGVQYDFTNFGDDGQWDIPQLTIWDGGGVDTLDLSGDDSGVTLDLRPGAFSSTHGMTNNISLAYVPGWTPNELAGYIENARGGEGDDVITGNDHDNVLEGNDGEDHLYGLGGDDILHGDDGNDWLQGGLGTDTFYGGAGVDTVDYTYSNGDWTISLAGLLDEPDGVGIAGTASAGGANEQIWDVENVTTGAGDDHITGSSQANTLSGNDGTDTLVGLAGDDTLYGGEGSDTLDGGDDSDSLYGEAGNDTLIGGNGNDTLYGGIGQDTIDAGNGNDVIHGQDGNDTIDGGAHNDSIWGEDGEDTILGGSGLDTISGGDGSDTIDGGADNDVITGGNGDDTISGNSGLDDLDGGAGSDTVDYIFANVNWTVDLAAETASSNFGVIPESVRNFEGARMGSGNDVVRGTAGTNNIYGGFGNDELRGLAGNDWLDGEYNDDLLNGGSGDDFIIGGTGNDTASYADDIGGVLVDLDVVGIQNTFGSGNDLLDSIEHLIGSAHSDFLFGSSVANQLTGGNGEDQLFGRGGNDTLTGGAGNDNLFGGLGNDALDGGSGTDWANYSLEAAGVHVNLALANAQNTMGAGFDTLTSIENVVGTASADLLNGNSGANRLEGGGGNDVITGGAGSDVLFGGAGSDTLNGGTGNDVLEGGTGTDWALYNTGLASGVTIDLYVDDQNTGGGGIDTLHSIENVWATSFADSLTGNDVANELRGEGGNDWIWGNAGDDVVNGGAGNDAVAGGSGADDVIGGGGNDHLWGGTNADDFIFDDSWGDDWIWDFQTGSDKIDLSAVAGLTSINQLDIESTNNGMLYSYNGQSILLVGVSPWQVQTTDFIL